MVADAAVGGVERAANRVRITARSTARAKNSHGRHGSAVSHAGGVEVA